MRELIKIIVLMVFAFQSVATVMAVTLNGNVKDAVSGEPLIQASLRVLAAKDSALVKGAVTDIDGRFNIQGIKAGKYIVEASYVGYNPVLRDITVADRNITLKPFELSESTVMLKEATVIGVRTPVKVMEDTVEFAADAYRTQPNAVVEDLLKRLPGVEVDSNGKITANGKSVSKILVDG
ncbi:MAG: carboxypeptidase-like regulatory domain-containing protein, partial [Muribaculaceae bacterium]|nr:carboxypeptidase-like regulatory domain-containing protein [Muribaculaceae bacterium]